ncbi:hypothetical protein B296_00029468 [Ensete ventricosum]|uniref:Uncharacterized protein n=1 Tax=Ensete ventricosum TaxID=4639 RepID=A0A426YNH0_ENSVE|nr:hypothetical protein B296_00029468 [Ensete ventricosum]
MEVWQILGRQWAIAVSDKGATMLLVAMTKRWRDSSGWYEAVIEEEEGSDSKQAQRLLKREMARLGATVVASSRGIGDGHGRGSGWKIATESRGERCYDEAGQHNRDLTSVMVSSGRGRSGMQQRGMRQWPGRYGCSRIGEKTEEAALEATGSSNGLQ